MATTTTTPPYLPTAVPTVRQLEFSDWELGLFLHFGIRTFYQGARDWDDTVMSPEQFDPTAFSADQWIATAAEAGFKYAVMTAKHHDGFANWPSKFTDFSVASSPWQDGKGDVVAAYMQACHKHGLAAGLYYSPADHSCPIYDDPKAYDDYFINQVSEILEPHGQVDMLWFDGCGSEGHEYDWPRIIGEVRRMQPNVLIFNMGDPDYRWVGNESGIAPVPCWNTVERVPFSVLATEDEKVAQPAWLPAECDCRMREKNWFFDDEDEHTVKSVEELVGLYDLSVGRGCNLLINIGPDRRGLLPDADAARLVEFGNAIRDRYANAIATFEQATTDDEGHTHWAFSEPAMVNHAVLMEDLTTGEHVRGYDIQIKPHPYGGWVTVHAGQSLGHKATCNFPPVRARELRVRFTDTTGEATLRDASVHHIKR